jgi:RNA polymerase sigma-70 factor (ECF subfamily)
MITTDKVDSQREGTDEALMVRYQRGDRNALTVMMRRYARQVYATAYGIVGIPELATELTQNAFLAMVGQAGSFHIEMQFRPWLFGFLHQLLADGNVNAPRGEAIAAQIQAGPDDADEAIASAAKSTRSQLLSRRIAECAATLPLLEREALVMKLTAQLTLTELAVATASTGEVVRSRLRFALDRLRESVSDTEEFARALR